MAAREARLKAVDFTDDVEKHLEALERAASRLSFLAEANRQLSTALTNQEVFQQVGQLIVPKYADFVVIAHFLENGTIQRVALSHVDPQKTEKIRSQLSKIPGSIEDNFGSGWTIRTGNLQYDRDADQHLKAFLERIPYSELREIMVGLGMRSYLTVPCEAHGQVLGALWMITSDSGRRLEQDDLKLATEIAQRVGAAMFQLNRYSNATKAVEILQIERDMRESFISTVRHDVLSVLTSAALAAELIKAKKDPEKSVQLAGRILTSINRASEILRNTKIKTDQS